MQVNTAAGVGTPLQELWTIQQVSAYLHVPVGTLYQWRHKGVGPGAYRAGKRLLYDAADVRRWLVEEVA
ncbi:MAG TPA: helix-turn-helix domain-containing protein [Nocardioidaceae bacterium]|nr:helix-turn-helix domain-containing protein [Nocardioidaceae bacterium]